MGVLVIAAIGVSLFSFCVVGRLICLRHNKPGSDKVHSHLGYYPGQSGAIQLSSVGPRFNAPYLYTHWSWQGRKSTVTEESRTKPTAPPNYEDHTIHVTTTPQTTSTAVPHIQPSDVPNTEILQAQTLPYTINEPLHLPEYRL